MTRSEPTLVVRVCRADYARPSHAQAVVAMLDAYARDPMGGGEALSDYARQNLVASLAARPFAFSVLAFDGADDSTPVGLVNCLEGFSTFACRPLVNVHDIAVKSGYRGQGIGEQMLALVESLARERGAVKLTLEVLTGNGPALRLYERFGFVNYQLDPALGTAGLMQKWLS